MAAEQPQTHDVENPEAPERVCEEESKGPDATHIDFTHTDEMHTNPLHDHQPVVAERLHSAEHRDLHEEGSRRARESTLDHIPRKRRGTFMACLCCECTRMPVCVVWV